MNHGLALETENRIRAVLARFPEVEKALLYGSRAKGNYKPGSDIDLALVGSKLSSSVLTCINNELDDLLLPHRIDTLIFAKITQPDLIDHIERVGVVFYDKQASPVRP